MRIGVNTLFMIPGEVGGAETYLRETLRALASNSPEHSQVLFTNIENDAALKEDLAAYPQVAFVSLNFRAGNRVNRVIREQIQLPAAVRRAGVDILWSPGYTAPLRVACPQVTSILDMQYKTHPEDLMALARWTTDILVRGAARNSRQVLTISEFSKTEITKHTGIASKNVVVTPLAADALAAALPSESEARDAVARLPGDLRRYILAVSNTYPHKNLEAAVEAFGRLENTIPHKLVVVGQPRLGEKKFLAAASKLSDPSRVQRYHHLEREALAALYVAADVFVFPSLYEGFGLPVLEAMVAGVPVVTGRFGSIPEVGGDTCMYVDSRSPEALAAGIGDVLGWGVERRKRHVEQACRHAGSFNWKRTAGRTLAALIAAAGQEPCGGRK